MTDPAGAPTLYGFGQSSGNRLDTVTYADGGIRQYHYDEAANVAAGTTYTQLLTGITDELGLRYATFKYNAQCRRSK